MQIDELIQKLEEAERGGNELNEMIARYFAHAKYEWWRNRAGPSDFTQSLSAAKSLIPPDPSNEITGKCDWQLESTNGGLTMWARVGPQETESFGNTEELALCVAALKAHKELEG